MELVEIRDLDGPNIFLRGPAIKIEFRGQIIDPAFQPNLIGWFEQFRRIDSTLGNPSLHQLETPGHFAVAFAWGHRAASVALAKTVAQAVITGEPSRLIAEEDFRALLASADPDDHPAMVTDAQRRMPVVGITGTNGKTTTTRLIAHLVMSTGKHAGWSSSSGVYIDGVEVQQGDYSGPSGARRVLQDPGVDVAILETARGGILLRGIAYESNDVSVFTNISADHLDLQGVHTVEGLARVKSVVVQITRPGGVAVLNADDRLVMGACESISARKLLFTCKSDNPVYANHTAAGGEGVRIVDGSIIHDRGSDSESMIELADIPVTFGGKAPHMVENALAAVGGAIGLGLTDEQIATGLRTFRNSTSQNPGRLNVFDVGGVLVVMDFAHNEVGLELLLAFSRNLAGKDGKVSVVAGTAGDRTDHSLTEIGRIAALHADQVIFKDTIKYLRGRTNEGLLDLYQAGYRSTGRVEAPVSPDELSGMQTLIAESSPGDVVAIMCHEQMNELRSWLESHGTALE